MAGDALTVFPAEPGPTCRQLRRFAWAARRRRLTSHAWRERSPPCWRARLQPQDAMPLYVRDQVAMTTGRAPRVPRGGRMSAQLRPETERYAPMTERDLDDVVEVERADLSVPVDTRQFR